MKFLIIFLVLFHSIHVFSKTVSYTLANSTDLYSDSNLLNKFGTVSNNGRIFLIDHLKNSKDRQFITIGNIRAWIRVKDIIIAYHPDQYYNHHVNYDRRKVIENYIEKVFSN